jgi:hypothetical protein
MKTKEMWNGEGQNGKRRVGDRKKKIFLEFGTVFFPTRYTSS